MTYIELQQAILDDSHRSDYAGAKVRRFISEGEARILAKIEAYILIVALADAQRVAPLGAEYNVAGKIVAIRQVYDSNGVPLDRVDETTASVYKTLGTSMVYVPRLTTILIAGTPGAGSTFTVEMFGLPPVLAADADTNSLLNDFPQLYKNAALVSLFQSAKDYEASQAALQDFTGLANEINRKTKKLLGGRRSSNPYNVGFRSSY